VLALAVVDVVLVDVLAAAEGEGRVPTGRLLQITTPGILGACLPEYVETNFATSSASFPTTMFWGMTAPEKPPFSIA
jgi:hypothetical protein